MVVGEAFRSLAREHVDDGRGDADRPDRDVPARALDRARHVGALVERPREEASSSSRSTSARDAHAAPQDATPTQIDRVRRRCGRSRRQEVQVRLQGRGAQGDGARATRPGHPKSRTTRCPTPTRSSRRRPSTSTAIKETPHAAPPAGSTKVNYGGETAQRCSRSGSIDRVDLPDRRDPAARRLDAADREHDPALDLLAAARDRGDEARRRDELVRARAVHARGPDLRLVGSISAVVLLLLGKASPCRRSSVTSRTRGSPRDRLRADRG